jgi:outer membrane immunogenic protein
LDLGRLNNSFTLVPLAPIAVNTSSRFTDHIARFGIDYHFSGPVVAKY